MTLTLAPPLWRGLFCLLNQMSLPALRQMLGSLACKDLCSQVRRFHPIHNERIRPQLSRAPLRAPLRMACST